MKINFPTSFYLFLMWLQENFKWHVLRYIFSEQYCLVTWHEVSIKQSPCSQDADITLVKTNRKLQPKKS